MIIQDYCTPTKTMFDIVTIINTLPRKNWSKSYKQTLDKEFNLLLQSRK